jgi:hypothetical protein
MMADDWSASDLRARDVTAKFSSRKESESRCIMISDSQGQMFSCSSEEGAGSDRRT